MALRIELQVIVERLVRASEVTRAISLDELGDAIGTVAVSYVEIDEMITVLEHAGRHVSATSDGRGETHLLSLLAATRSLAAELGRRPSIAEIRLRSGLSEQQLKQGLLLARVMQR